MAKIISAYSYSAARGFEAKAYIFHSETEARVFYSNGFGGTPMDATLEAVQQIVTKCKANGTAVPTDIEHVGKIPMSTLVARLF